MVTNAADIVIGASFIILPKVEKKQQKKQHEFILKNRVTSFFAMQLKLFSLLNNINYPHSNEMYHGMYNTFFFW